MRKVILIPEAIQLVDPATGNNVFETDLTGKRIKDMAPIEAVPTLIALVNSEPRWKDDLEHLFAAKDIFDALKGKVAGDSVILEGTTHTKLAAFLRSPQRTENGNRALGYGIAYPGAWLVQLMPFIGAVTNATDIA